MDAQLANPLLDPAWIAAQPCVSLRTLQRAFADQDESLAAHIRNRRLARARDELATSNHSISVIASSWRFSDSSHFTRSFKQRYGMTPGEYREALPRGNAWSGAVTGSSLSPDGRPEWIA